MSFLSKKSKQELVDLYKAFFDEVNTNDQYATRPCFNFKVIKGNRILFVSQNPGQPFSFSDKALFNSMTNDSFKEYQMKFNKSWLTSRFGKFFRAFCNLVDSNFLNEVSFTNFVKMATKNNSFPNITKTDIDLFTKELEIINPKIVIVLSRATGRWITKNLKLVNQKNLYIFDHPANYKYSIDFAHEIAKFIKKAELYV